MTLFEFHADLGRVASALERIAQLVADLLKVEATPRREIRPYQATVEDLKIVTPADVAHVDEEKAAFAAQFGVMPDSEQFYEYLAWWHQEQQKRYGETWQPPQDWRTICAAARGEFPPGRAGDSAGPADR